MDDTARNRPPSLRRWHLRRLPLLLVIAMLIVILGTSGAFAGIEGMACGAAALSIGLYIYYRRPVRIQVPPNEPPKSD